MKPTLCLSLLCFLVSPHLQADDIAVRGRRILENHKHVVVTVRMVQNSMFSMPGMAGDSSESRSDATGTMIGPDGLTVLSLTTTDPDSLMQSVLSGLGSADDGFNFSMKTELSDLRILLHDNTELPSEVVLRDKVQDLIFIRPKTKPDRVLPHVDLRQNGSAEILDHYIALNRLGKVAGRAYSASTGRISAISERPRTIYFPEGSQTTSTMGAPVFNLSGDILGIFVMRAVRSGGDRTEGFYGGGTGSVATIILPATEILKVSDQVPPWEE